jgi:hypothetical protein
MGLVEAKRRERVDVEVAAALQIADADREVVDHRPTIGHAGTVTRLRCANR